MADKFRVLISDSMSELAPKTLAASSVIEVTEQGGMSADELIQTIGSYNGLLVRSRTKVTAEVIEAATSLAIIGRAGIGVDNIDIKAASRRGIIVENAPNGNSITTAEHAICLLTSLARNIPQATASMKLGKWEKKKLGGRELYKKYLGIIGLGNIGRIVADRAIGLRMNVLGADPFISAANAEALATIGVELVELNELLARADFISIHAPLTEKTKGLLSSAEFDRVKPGVMLINAARGGIVDEQALVAALESGQVAGAAVDVFSSEPPSASDPLVNHPRVICTPHLGASTKEAQDKVALEIASQMVAFAERGEMIHSINSVSVSAEQREELQPWLELATSLGALTGQRFMSQGVSRVESRVEKAKSIVRLELDAWGIPGKRLGAITSAALVGLLQSIMDGPINPVNARVLAEEADIEVVELGEVLGKKSAEVSGKKSGHQGIHSSISIRANSAERSTFVRGTLFDVGERMEPRVIQLDEVRVEAPASGHLLVLKNEDKPGIIGQVGTLLGEHDINVNSLHMGQDSDGRIAVAMWNLASPPDRNVLVKLRSIANVIGVEAVSL